MERKLSVDAPAAFIARTDVNAASERCRTFGHAAQTMPGADADAVGSAVVGDLDVERVRPRPDTHVRVRCVRVTQHVGHRLLHDPKCRSADRGRDGSAVDLDIHIRAHAGRPGIVDESRERLEIERRLGRSGVALVAQEAKCRAKIA
jgi:hypothetical protein